MDEIFELTYEQTPNLQRRQTLISAIDWPEQYDADAKPTVLVMTTIPIFEPRLGVSYDPSAWKLSCSGPFLTFSSRTRRTAQPAWCSTGQSGLDFQRELAAANWQLPIIFITGHGDIPMSVQAMKGGRR